MLDETKRITYTYTRLFLKTRRVTVNKDKRKVILLKVVKKINNFIAIADIQKLINNVSIAEVESI